MIDADGFRPNVGIMLTNAEGKLLWARRIKGQDAWQFPQGGINPNETPEKAMYRELNEEVGLHAKDVKILGCTRGWLRYHLPKRLVRKGRGDHTCIGQKQKWFLLQLLSDDSAIDLNVHGVAEFDDWRWVSYWYPLGKVVSFKQDVYRKAMKELAPLHSRLQQQA